MDDDALRSLVMMLAEMTLRKLEADQWERRELAASGRGLPAWKVWNAAEIARCQGDIDAMRGLLDRLRADGPAKGPEGVGKNMVERVVTSLAGLRITTADGTPVPVADVARAMIDAALSPPVENPPVSE